MSKGAVKRSGGGGGGAPRAAPGERAAERLGIEYTPEFGVLYRDRDYRQELDRIAWQAEAVKNGRMSEAETSWGRAGMKMDEYAAAMTYSGWDYRRINKQLRGEPTSLNKARNEKDREFAKAMEKVLSRGLERSPEAAGTAYRGFSSVGTEALRNAKPGDVIRDRAFLSTTTNEGVAKNFGTHQMVIHHRSGRDFSRAVGGAESEVLFKPGAKFRVRSVSTQANGSTTIHVEEI